MDDYSLEIAELNLLIESIRIEKRKYIRIMDELDGKIVGAKERLRDIANMRIKDYSILSFNEDEL